MHIDNNNKNIKQGHKVELTYIFVGLLDHAYEVLQTIERANGQIKNTGTW